MTLQSNSTPTSRSGLQETPDAVRIHELLAEHEELLARALDLEKQLRSLLLLPPGWVVDTGVNLERFHIYTVNGDYDSRIEVAREELPHWIVDPIGSLSRHFNMPIDAIQTWIAAKECSLLCERPGCKNRHVIRAEGENYPTPRGPLFDPYKRWVCPAHRQQAWEDGRTLGDDMLRVLHAIRAEPGRGRTFYLDYCAASNPAVKFLESAGLVSVTRFKVQRSRPHQLLDLTPDGVKAIHNAKSPPFVKIYFDLDAHDLLDDDTTEWSFKNNPLAHWVRIQTRSNGEVFPLENHLCGERVSGNVNQVCETKSGSIGCSHWLGCKDDKALCDSIIVNQ